MTDDPDCRGFEQVDPIDITLELPRHSTKTYDRRSVSEIGLLVVHTTDWKTTPQRIVEYDIGPNHISRTGCPGSTYHEFIMGDGVIYKALEDEEISWHAGKWNKKSYAVALMYRCTPDDPRLGHNVPPHLAMKSLHTRLGDLCFKFGLDPSDIKGHRELEGTGWFWHKGSRRLRKSCPGLRVDMDDVRKTVAKYMQCVLKMKGHYPGKVDGLWGPLSRRGMNEYMVERMLQE